MKGIGDKPFNYDSGGVECVIYSIPIPVHELIL